METISKHLNLGLILIIAILIYGCTPEYIPNTLNVPMLQKKGEFQASINVGGFTFFDPQLAYAATDHIGLLLNSSFQNTTGKEGDFHKHILGEFGAGYFNKLGKSFSYELFAGYGYNTLNTQRTITVWPFDTYYSDTKTDRFFLQGNIGFVSDFLEYSFASRFTYNFIKDNYNNRNVEAIVFDPALSIKFVKNPLKISGQVGVSYPIYNKDEEFILFKPYIVAIGVHYFFLPKI